MKKLFVILITGFVLLSCKTSSSSINPAGRLEMRGMDISWYDQINSLGGKYFLNGKETSLFTILKKAGVNWIRLRLWVNPENHWCNLEHTLKTAKLIKKEGFNFLLDIHYSDTWADPSNQKIPSDWQSLSYENLCKKVENYTEDVLSQFNKENCSPDMIQTGNEITNGMLWPFGKNDGGDCTKLMELLKIAGTSCRKICPSAKIMIHLDRGGDNTTASWWFSEAQKADLDYDVIGLSYYPFFHGTDLSIVGKNISSLKTEFKKEVCIAETSYPWTFGWKDSTQNQVGTGAQLLSDCPATIDGQKKYFSKLNETILSAGGTGLFYWEGDAVCTEGFENPLENQAWFDFDGNWTGITF